MNDRRDNCERDYVKTDASSCASSGAFSCPDALSRRSFINLASTAFGTALTATALLSGCVQKGNNAQPGEETPSAEPSSPESIIASSRGQALTSITPHVTLGADALPIEPVQPPNEWTYKADIVVCGAGGGGLLAAAWASTLGARVVVLEKTEDWGGAARQSVIWQDAQDATADDSIVQPWELALRAVRSYLSSLGADLETEGFGEQLFRLLYNEAVNQGAEFLFKTPVVSLVVRDGEIEGVKAKGLKGDVYVRANKGVLLATGGMTNNQNLLAAYCPSVPAMCLTSSAPAGDVGDGIRIGLGVGGVMAGWDASLWSDGGVDCDEWLHDIQSADVTLARHPWLGIDVKGNRYASSWQELASSQRAAVLAALPGRVGYIIFDDAYQEALSSALDSRDDGAEDDSDSSPLAAGFIASGDTIKELAVALGMPEKTVRAAIDEWNDICSKGTDTQGGFDSADLKPLEPPYYAMRTGATCLSTFAGLATSSSMRLLAQDGSLLKGLYACGCVLGGFHGQSTFGQCTVLGGGVAFACATACIAVCDMLHVEPSSLGGEDSSARVITTPTSTSSPFASAPHELLNTAGAATATTDTSS